jgi:hypothetical protein
MAANAIGELEGENPERGRELPVERLEDLPRRCSPEGPAADSRLELILHVVRETG